MGSKRVLEWVGKEYNDLSGAAVNDDLNLALRDDEIAEIHKIMSEIMVDTIDDAANDRVQIRTYLSMDPDASLAPSSATTNDLETFYSHDLSIQQEVGAAGTAAVKTSDHKQASFDPPLLVGTNIGRVMNGDASIDSDIVHRVYFTRRKATAAELNQILLKRR